MTTNISDRTFFSLALIGFSEEDKTNFESVLSIAEPRLNIPWKIVAVSTADFYLIFSPLLNKDELIKDLPRERCIFYTFEEENKGDHELLVGDNSLPSLRSLMILFNQLSDNKPQINTAPPQASNNTSASTQSTSSLPASSSAITNTNKNNVPVDNDDYFDPEQGLLKYLLSDEKCIYCFTLDKKKNNDKLYVDLEKASYYSKHKPDKLNVFFSKSDQLSSVVTSEIELQKEMTKQGLKQQPLSHLIWLGVFSCSKGRPINGYDKDDIVHLTRWPDLTLPGCRQLINLAAFMQSNSVTLSTVQKLTNIPIEQIYNFYNACKIAGLVKKVQKTDLHEKTLEEDSRQLFAKISTRLDQESTNKI